MELEEAAIRTQVERLLQSKVLEGSDSNRRLLSYLTDKALAGEAEHLKEYTIALEAFAKPPSYDPRHDSVVRIQLGRLRQKLTQYYLAEGSADPIVVSLPKGAFRLQFDQSDKGRRQSREQPWKTLAIAFGAATVLLGLWGGFEAWALGRVRHDARPALEQWSPELTELWAPLLDSRRPLLLCIGTPLFVRFPAFGFFRDPAAGQWEELQASTRFQALEKSLGNPAAMPWYTFTGTGEANAAFLLGKLLAARRADVSLTRSSILSWQQVADNELIFIGPPKFNKQLDALPAVRDRDIVMEPRGIRNRHPKSGEPEFLEDRFESGPQFDGETHALISLVPGISGTSDLLILSGNASADTFAAAEYLTEATRARQLAGRLRLPSGKLPRYYQVVLNVKFRNGIPVQTSYVYHHLIQ
jgi:hypothetical protein